MNTPFKKTFMGKSPFKKDKEYEPQTKTRGYKGGEHTDSTPQSQMQKMSVDELEGEMWGIMDNEYTEAKDRGDTSEIARYEAQIDKFEKEIESRKSSPMKNPDSGYGMWNEERKQRRQDRVENRRIEKGKLSVDPNAPHRGYQKTPRDGWE